MFHVERNRFGMKIKIIEKESKMQNKPAFFCELGTHSYALRRKLIMKIELLLQMSLIMKKY